jgi:hypothetical protein
VTAVVSSMISVLLSHVSVAVFANKMAATSRLLLELSEIE